MHDARGFSLVEVLAAMTILTVAIVALAQLFTISIRANDGAKTTTIAAVLAQQKMEQLRGLLWAFDALGLPLTDTTTDTSVVPERPAGGRGLSPSPSDALAHNTEGYCDFVDGSGRLLGGGATPPEGALYIRRWSIEPLPTNPNNTIILQVLVMRWRGRGAAATAGRVIRLPDEARLASARTRKAM